MAKNQTSSQKSFLLTILMTSMKQQERQQGHMERFPRDASAGQPSLWRHSEHLNNSGGMRSLRSHTNSFQNEWRTQGHMNVHPLVWLLPWRTTLMKTQMPTLSLPSNELFLSLIFPTLACFPLACCFVKHHHCALFNATNYLYRFLSCSFSPLLLVFCLHVISFSTRMSFC